ncbi:hypothetical protein PCANC_28174 [Puccinia coronata f. sp. avenae]|uniref:Uncharacterized protein n=1 Tax=Puccinia coronata f. sp. avenae TaxID=200324 RepID=A0A2N5THC3_9BASI|nr:hypothetical protein PCANC_28174 [Puccinia coronata f. sp. avenae]
MADQPSTTSPSNPPKGKAIDAKVHKTQASFTPVLTGHPTLKLSSTIEKLKSPRPRVQLPGLELGYRHALQHHRLCSVIAQTIESANIRSICHLHKDRRAIWNGLRAAHQDSSSGGVMYWMRKLFLSRHQGDDIEPHLEEMAKIFKRLNALTNPERPLTQDDFYTTAIFTSLSPDWLPCVSSLMNEPYAASRRVISALKQEGLRRKAQAEDILNPTTASSAKTRSSSTPSNQGGAPKCCTFCNVDGHDLNTCFNTARILCKAKARRHQGADSQSDPTQ